MFGSILSYIALRLLGEGPEDGEDRAMARGRGWTLDRGGAVATPSWGKFWLSVWLYSFTRTCSFTQKGFLNYRGTTFVNALLNRICCLR